MINVNASKINEVLKQFIPPTFPLVGQKQLKRTAKISLVWNDIRVSNDVTTLVRRKDPIVVYSTSCNQQHNSLTKIVQKIKQGRHAPMKSIMRKT